MIWLSILIIFIVLTILGIKYIDEYLGYLFIFWALLLFLLWFSIENSFGSIYKYELDEPTRYEITEQEAKIYYNEIKNDEKVIIKNGNTIIKADSFDTDVNPSITNYVEYYNLTKFKKTKYYWSAFPGNRDYLVFHFTDEIKNGE